jgi:trimeric autotransporter adhesin
MTRKDSQKGNRLLTIIGLLLPIFVVMHAWSFKHAKGDGGLATSAKILLDGSGGLLVAEYTRCQIRRIDLASGIVTVIAGRREDTFSGDGGPAIKAGLRRPDHMALDSAGNLFFTDMGNQRIRRVDRSTGAISTVAGNGDYRTSGDGGPAIDAGLTFPNSIAIDKEGNLFISQG